MLSSNVVAVSRQGWARDRETASWYSQGEDVDEKKTEPNMFRFTRATAMDQRLRYEGAMAADRRARALFTADQWDWTAENREDVPGQMFKFR